MDITRWKYILNEWVTKTELVKELVVARGLLEHIDVNLFYDQFKTKIQQIDPSLENDLKSFLAVRFPSYEILYDDTNNISSQDYMYIFSLLLFYSCVVQVDKFFQQCCGSLDSKLQSNVAKFFASLKESLENKRPITKKVLREAIKGSMPSPPSIRFINSSPLKTPDKTPPTPNKLLVQERLKELQKLKTMLENERYERNMLDAEVKQFEEKIDLLVNEKKRLKQDLQKLQLDQMMSKDTENLSPNKAIRDEQIRLKMQKEISAREETIINLRCDIDDLMLKNQKCSGRIELMTRERNELKSKWNDQISIIEELKEDVVEKKIKIQQLEETNNDLRNYISETRNSSQRDASSDCLDSSMLYLTAMTNGSNDSGENLAKAVIDVQLKEQENENQQLKEKLEVMIEEKETLEMALNEHMDTIVSLHREIKENSLKFNKTIVTLQSQLKEKSTENKNLSTEVASLTIKNETSTKENENLKSGVLKAQEEIKEMKRTVQQNLQALKSQLKAAEDGRKEFQEMLEKEKINFSNLRKSYNEETESFSKKLDLLRAESNEKSLQMQEGNDRLTIAIEELNKFKEMFEAEKVKSAKQHEIEIASHNQQLDSLRAKMETASKENKGLQAENMMAKEEVEKAQGKLESLEAQLKAAQKEAQEVQQKLEAEKNNSSSLSNGNNEKIASLNQQLESLRAKSDEKSSEIQSLAAQSQIAQDELNILLKTEKANLLTLRGEHQTIIDSYNQQLESLRAEMETVLKKNEGLEAENMMAKEEVEMTQGKLESLEAQLNAAQKEAQELQQKLEAEKINSSSLSNGNNEKIASLNQQLESLRAKSDEKSSEIQSLAAQSQIAQDELNILLKTEKANLLTLRGEHQTVIDSYNQQLESLRAEMETALKKNEGLEAENMMAKEEVEKAQGKLESLEAQLNAAQKEAQEVQQKLEAEKINSSSLSNGNNEKIASLNQQLESLRAESDEKSSEIQSLAAQSQIAQDKLNELNILLESEKTSFLTLRNEHETVIDSYNQQLDEMKNQVQLVQQQLETSNQELEEAIKSNMKLEQKLTSIMESKSFETSRVDKLYNDLKIKTEALELQHKKEILFNDKLSEENRIYNAKLMKVRQEKDELQKNFDAERKRFETREDQLERKSIEDVNEVRLEMGDKLEKMKAKMVSVYNQEITKWKDKMTAIQDDLERKNKKQQQYEQHIEKLSKQCQAFDELKIQNSNMIKENDYMRSKIRFMEANGGMQMTGSIGMSRMPSTMTQINSANLGMEDEAGEVFNNTYLADLKSGGSQFSLDKTVVLSASEMQQRNSMYPQHMRDSYAVGGFDRDVGEHEMKNGVGIFDNSQTALLSQNGHNRKKQSTSYKRPGPPTPSKLAGAGRLSIGGIADIGYQNILSDCTNKENKKTPGRLKNFFGNVKKEPEFNARHRKVKAFANSKDAQSEDDENEPSHGNLRIKEEDRKKKRNEARDQNRPHFKELFSTSSDSAVEDDGDDQWSEDDGKPVKPRDPNESLDYVRQIEEWQKNRKKARRSSFNKNRRSSNERSSPAPRRLSSLFSRNKK